MVSDTLPAVQHVLDTFSSISLYKLNHSKFLMLNLGLDHQTTNTISTKSPFAWAPNSFLHYLGIQLTFPSHILLRTNLEDLVGKLMWLSKELNHIPASWTCRMAQVRMYLLPHILYLFHTIPLPLVQAQIRKLQGIVKNFTW